MAYNIRLPRRTKREENRVQQKAHERDGERERADCERRKKRFKRSSR